MAGRCYFVPAARFFVWACWELSLARDRTLVVFAFRAEILTGVDGGAAALFRRCGNKPATIFFSRSSLDEEIPYTSAASSIVGYGVASFTGLLILPQEYRSPLRCTTTAPGPQVR